MLTGAFGRLFGALALVKAVGILASLSVTDAGELERTLVTSTWAAGALLLLSAPRGDLGRVLARGGAWLLVISAVPLLWDAETYRNHLYLLAVVALVLALFDERHHAPLLRAQTTIVYAFAALLKVNGTYLSGARLEAELTANPVWLALGMDTSLLPALAVASVAAEAFLAVALWFPAMRRAAFGVGVGLHVGIVAFTWTHPLVLLELVVFNALLMSLWLAFRGYTPGVEPSPVEAAAVA